MIDAEFEAAIEGLRAKGHSALQCVALIKLRYGLDLKVAKSLVYESRTWADERHLSPQDDQFWRDQLPDR